MSEDLWEGEEGQKVELKRLKTTPINYITVTSAHLFSCGCFNWCVAFYLLLLTFMMVALTLLSLYLAYDIYHLQKRADSMEDKVSRLNKSEASGRRWRRE